MSKFDAYLDEGILKADKRKSKVAGNSEQEAFEKLQDFLDKNKSYNPKAGSKKPMRDNSGRYYFDVTYDAVAPEDDKSAWGLAKKAGGAIGKVAGAVKKAYGEVTANKVARISAGSEELLNKERAKIVNQYPDAKFLKIRKDEDGNFIQQFTYTTKAQEPKEKATPKKEVEKTEVPDNEPDQVVKVSNIEKRIRNLSPENLNNLQNWLVKIQNQEVQKDINKDDPNLKLKGPKPKKK